MKKPKPSPATVPESPPPTVQEIIAEAHWPFNDARKAINAAEDAITKVARSWYGAEIDTVEVQRLCSNLHLLLDQATPKVPCPAGVSCLATCRLCKGRGWISRVIWDYLPETYK